MRITIELDPESLDAVSRLTGIGKKSPAIAQAIEEYIRGKEREAFLKSVMAGETDYGLSNEELEESTRWEGASGECS